MKPRRIRFTATAQRHVRREKAWWIENRIHTEVFAAEFEGALRILAFLPGAGTGYDQVGPGAARITRPVAPAGRWNIDQPLLVGRVRRVHLGTSLWQAPYAA